MKRLVILAVFILAILAQAIGFATPTTLEEYQLSLDSLRFHKYEDNGHAAVNELIDTVKVPQQFDIVYLKTSGVPQHWFSPRNLTQGYYDYVELTMKDTVFYKGSYNVGGTQYYTYNGAGQEEVIAANSNQLANISGQRQLTHKFTQTEINEWLSGAPAGVTGVVDNTAGTIVVHIPLSNMHLAKGITKRLSVDFDTTVLDVFADNVVTAGTDLDGDSIVEPARLFSVYLPAFTVNLH